MGPNHNRSPPAQTTSACPLVNDDDSPITPLASVIRCQAYRAYLRVKRYSQWANDEARRDDSFIHGEDARSWNVALNTRADR